MSKGSRKLTRTVGNLTRSYLQGRSSGDVVKVEREEVISMLIDHKLANAAHAMRQANNASFREFFEIRRVILSGGPRLMRLKNGRGIEQ